ncbi:MAG TPA: SOS response-associated peptidase [Chitinophagaceae bacterium]|nr:SOS response-associated peptidase [Chitinophagaceae bacterium]
MCNFYGHKISRLHYIRLQQIEKDLGSIAALQELEVLKNGFAYGNAPVLRKSAPGDFEIVPMHWEFIPHWVKTMDDVMAARKQGIPWLNATCEKLLDSKMFRNAALKRRCLVLASYFFEWRSYKPDGAKKEIKYPYAIELNDADYFFMAGIWQPWTDQSTGETLDTFAIVTTSANELMEEIHNTKKRMPVILPEDLAWEWMMEDLSEERIRQIACYQLPAENMYPYSIRKDFKALENPLEPFDYDELPPLDVAI